jgi:MFS family permease
MSDSDTPETASPQGSDSTMPKPDPERKPLFVDISPLRRSPAFARMWLGDSISGIGGQVTIVAVGLQIYDITHSTLAVSFVALFALVPMIIAGIYGGMLADAFDRRLVALLAAIGAWVSVAGIALLAWTHVDVPWPLYILTTINAVASTMINTTRSALTPRLLPKELLPAASALNGISFGTQITVGPAIAGVLVAAVGFGWTYSFDVLLFVCSFLGIVTLPPILPEKGALRPGLSSVREGFRFLRGAPNLRMSFLVDIVAMTFGQPRVLYPAVGALVLGGGAVTVGVLTAAYAIGGLVSSVFSGRFGHVRLQGRAVERAITVYGLCILGFGLVLAALSTGFFGTVTSSWTQVNLPGLILAGICLAAAGGADNVSSIFRNTILQVAAPDAMRGRIQGVFTVVVTGGPRVGDLYTGIIATVAALWLAPVLGGVVIVVLVIILVRFTMGGAFRRYDALNPKP